MAKARQQEEEKIAFPRRGDIYLVEFDPTRGHEIQKTRPALVATSGRRERSRSGTSSSPSSCWMDWLAADCVMPLAAAAREKLRSLTTSQ